MAKKNKKIDEFESYFGPAELKPIPKKDYDRFWKWMMVPLMDVPDEELIWCFKQDRQNSYVSKCVWESEIERRGLKI